MDKLERLQLDIAALLGTIPALQYTRTVVASPRIDESGDLVAAPEIIEALDRALNGIDQTGGKAGTIVVVQLPQESIIDHKLRGDDYICEAAVVVRIEENMMINRGAGGGGRTCAELANDCFIALHGYSMAGAVLQADDKRSKDPRQYRDGILAYDLRFTCIWGRTMTERCKRPQAAAVSLSGNAVTTEAGGALITESGDPIIAEEGGAGGAGLEITLTTATSGAPIYYTTDGSFPTSTNGTLYTAPFTILTDCTLRAVAYKTGLNPSPLLQSAIDVA